MTISRVNLGPDLDVDAGVGGALLGVGGLAESGDAHRAGMRQGGDRYAGPLAIDRRARRGTPRTAAPRQGSHAAPFRGAVRPLFRPGSPPPPLHWPSRAPRPPSPARPRGMTRQRLLRGLRRVVTLGEHRREVPRAKLGLEMQPRLLVHRPQYVIRTRHRIETGLEDGPVLRLDPHLHAMVDLVEVGLGQRAEEPLHRLADAVAPRRHQLPARARPFGRGIVSTAGFDGRRPPVVVARLRPRRAARRAPS